MLNFPLKMLWILKNKINQERMADNDFQITNIYNQLTLSYFFDLSIVKHT